MNVFSESNGSQATNSIGSSAAGMIRKSSFGLCHLGAMVLLGGAVALWLAPGANLSPDLVLMKLFLTAFCAIFALTLIRAAPTAARSTVELDTERQEVREIDASRSGREVLRNTRFGDLGRAEQTGPLVRMWDKGGALLAEVSLRDAASLNSLTSGLRSVGKL